MKKITWILATAVGALSVSGVLAYVNDSVSGEMPAPPAAPQKSPVELLLAQPFEMAEPATHWFRAERPQYRSGWLLVLAVEPSLVVPRQSLEPVLYVGNQTANRINQGNESGRVVCIVPSELGKDGKPALDLASAPIFFGTAGLPEQVDAARVAVEVADARKAGVRPPTAEAVAAATKPRVAFADEWELKLFASDLIEDFSPSETSLISGLRAPRVGR